MPSHPVPAPKPKQVPLLGMLYMMGSGLSNQGMNAMIRVTAAMGVHPFEIAFFRCVFGTIFLTGMLSHAGLAALRTTRPWLHLARATLNAASMLCFFLALTIEPLAKLSALMFTSPLFAALGAAFVLRERMDLSRWAGLVVGFAGALIVVRPGAGEMSLGIWLAMVSASTWGAALVLIKVQSRTESSLTIAIYAAVLLLPFNGAGALFFWSWPTLEMLAWMAGIGLLGTLGQIALGSAFRHADATVVLPFDFTKLIWAALVGYLVFGEVPGLWTWVGGTVIFMSSMFMAYRERAARLAVA